MANSLSSPCSVASSNKTLFSRKLNLGKGIFGTFKPATNSETTLPMSNYHEPILSLRNSVSVPTRSTNSLKAALTNTLRRFLQSTVFWLLALLLIFDLGIATVRPLKFVPITKFILLDQNPIVAKIPEFLSSNTKPDVLVLGSSLPMTAIAHWDSKFVGGIDIKDLDNVRSYTKACYLEYLIEKQCRHKVSVANLTCVACMASDATLILSRTLDTGKMPKLVLYGVAPRDLVDNSVPEIGKTPAFEVLADWKCLKDLLDSHVSSIDIRDFLISTAWYYYKVKADYRTFFIHLVCSWLNRPSSIYAATRENLREDGKTKVVQDYSQPSQSVAEIAAKAENALKTKLPAITYARIPNLVKADLLYYDNRYNPPNFRRLNNELKHLEKMSKLCQEHGIELVVFNMPITQWNKRLISPKLYTRYKSGISDLCRCSHTKFIDLDEGQSFIMEDFYDSAHTNYRGGKKIQDRLISALNCGNL